MKTQLTDTIEIYLNRELNIYLDTAKIWTVKEMLKEVYDSGIKRGKEQKAKELVKALGIKI